MLDPLYDILHLRKVEKTIAQLRRTGLKLNVAKTVVGASESRPPQTFRTLHGETLKVLECIFFACGQLPGRLALLDGKCHLQAALGMVHANGWMCCD